MPLLQTQITDRIATLLATCKGVSYPSLVGTTVKVGQARGAEQQAPAIFVMPEVEQASGLYATQLITRTFRLAAFAKLSAHPTYSEHGLIDQIIRDVRKVMETRDSTLVGYGANVKFISATPGYHEDGGQLVGASLQYEIQYPQAAPPA